MADHGIWLKDIRQGLGPKGDETSIREHARLCRIGYWKWTAWERRGRAPQRGVTELTEALQNHPRVSERRLDARALAAYGLTGVGDLRALLSQPQIRDPERAPELARPADPRPADPERALELGRRVEKTILQGIKDRAVEPAEAQTTIRVLRRLGLVPTAILSLVLAAAPEAKASECVSDFARFENWFGRKLDGGSNPSPSVPEILDEPEEKKRRKAKKRADARPPRPRLAEIINIDDPRPRRARPSPLAAISAGEGAA